MTRILHRKKSDGVDMVNLGKFTANVQKRLKPGSFKADFLYDEKKTIPRKKAQNSYINVFSSSNFDYYRDLYKTQLIRK